MTTTNVTGLSLKVERVARRVKATALAEAMGVSKSRVSAIEREGYPTNDMIARYRAALDTCDASPTSGEVA
jgi:transcriptional regulator with XRE-family HTH domain